MEPFMACRLGTCKNISMNSATDSTGDFGNQNSRSVCSTLVWRIRQSRLLNFIHSHFTEKVVGTQLMSLAEMLDYVEDKAEFEEMLRTMDMPASAIKNPTCIGKLSRREPLALDDLHFLRTLTKKPVKITLPGPYLLTRSMWVGALTRQAYGHPTEMADDIVGILRDELIDLRDAGCDFVQFDEPVLTEIVMSEECDRRTFM